MAARSRHPGRGALALFTAVLAGGCFEPDWGPDCLWRDTWCEGDTLMAWEWTGLWPLRQSAVALGSCGAGLCVDACPEAFCALDPAPEPACPDGEFAATCAGDELLECRSGYLTARTRCEDACVVHEAWAFCAESAEPWADCQGRDRTCEGADLVRCFLGYPVARARCPAACAPADDGGFCALSDAPFRACADRSYACQGTDRVTCRHGFVTAREPCPVACALPAAGDAFCNAEDEPAPACRGTSGAACDGPDVVTCRDGFTTARTACPEACAAGEGVARCAEAAPLPACDGWTGACDGMDAVECLDGRVVARVRCLERCVPLGDGGALCALQPAAAEPCAGLEGPPDRCVGAEVFTCRAGLTVAHDTCEVCFGEALCVGGVGWPCRERYQCRAGLSCEAVVETGAIEYQCTRSCDCPPSADGSPQPCAVCLDSGRDEAVLPDPLPLCVAGWCRYPAAP